MCLEVERIAGRCWARVAKAAAKPNYGVLCVTADCYEQTEECAGAEIQTRNTESSDLVWIETVNESRMSQAVVLHLVRLLKGGYRMSAAH